MIHRTCIDCGLEMILNPRQHRAERCLPCKRAHYARKQKRNRDLARGGEAPPYKGVMPTEANLRAQEWNDDKWDERMRAVEEGLDMGMSAEGIASDCNVLLTSLMDNLRRRGATELLDRLRKRRDGRRYRKAS